jgi:uncharacterized membrane protein
MSEAAVVNLFLVVRVTLVGGLLLGFPRITRKGLLFGAYVGEDVEDSFEGRILLRSWDRGVLAVMVSSIALGLFISFAGHPVAGNLTGTAFLLTAGFGLYLRAHARARPLIPAGIERQAQLGRATLQSGRPQGEVLAKSTAILCAVTALITLTYAIISFRAMPDRVPSLAGPFGPTDGLTQKSLITFLLAPALNLLLSPFYALGAWMITTAKLSVREGTDFRSAAAQLAFRATSANIFSVTAVFVCVTLTLFSIQMTRVGLSQIQSLGTSVWVLPLVLFLFMVGSLIRILTRFGQGGSLMERGSEEEGLTGALADNAHWVWGLFYVNRDDPSMIIESRFGIGYTMNYGNPMAVVLTLFLAILPIAVIALGIFLVALR